MAINLRNHTRPIMPKVPKIRNAPMVDKYRSDHPHCETCQLNGDIRPADDVHHLCPGTGRTDEIWNIIRLCRGCHILVTEHIGGEEARRLNLICVAIKLVRKEMKEATARLHWDWAEVVLALAVVKAKYDQLKKGVK